MFASYRDLGRDFWVFRLGQLFSLMGDSCGAMAVSWWVMEKTGSAQSVSAVLAPVLAAQIFLRPLFAPFADRYERRTLALWSDVLRLGVSLSLMAMAFADVFHVWAIAALLLLGSAGNALFAVSTRSMLPQLVRPERLKAAAAQTEQLGAAGTLFGGALAGFCIHTLNIKGAFAVDASTFAVSIVTLALIRSSTRIENPSPTSGKNPLAHWAFQIREGFSILFRLHLLMKMALLVMVINFALAPMAVLLTAIVQDTQNLPPWYLGLLEMGLGLGTILGVNLLSPLLEKVKTDTSFLLAFLGVAVCCLVLAVWQNPWAQLGSLFFMGAFVVQCNMTLQTYILGSLPNSVRARLVSSLGLMANGISPISVLVCGWLAREKSPMMAFYVMGGVVFLASFSFVFSHQVRTFLRVEVQDAKSWLQEKYDFLKTIG